MVHYLECIEFMIIQTRAIYIYEKDGLVEYNNGEKRSGYGGELDFNKALQFLLTSRPHQLGSGQQQAFPLITLIKSCQMQRWYILLSRCGHLCQVPWIRNYDYSVYTGPDYL